MSSRSQKAAILLHNTQKNEKAIRFKKDYSGLICLNCTSYMAGVFNVFNTNKMAINQKDNIHHTRQAYGDGKIEFVCFKNEASLGLERYTKQAGKVTQGGGPFIIEFKNTNKFAHQYLHIDGESMKVEKIKSIKISMSNLTPTGKIRVLENKKTN